jgi:type I restriction-modification system DNA methylase subunit
VANSPENHSDLDYTDTLWQAADKLRGTAAAAEYKHVVLGLLFLKYISDSFESRRVKLKEEEQLTKVVLENFESRDLVAPPANAQPPVYQRSEILADQWVPARETTCVNLAGYIATHPAGQQYGG